MSTQSTPRTKRQHFVPRFYLANFCDAEGYLWTHDSRQGKARRTFPEDTGFETNIYSPEIADGKRFDEIENSLAAIESAAAPLVQRLIRLEKLSGDEKSVVALFIAAMFVRSPAQIRQFAHVFGQVAGLYTRQNIKYSLNEKRKMGTESEFEKQILDLISDNDALEMDVDRRAGLMSFAQLESIASIIERMTWSFEISEHEQIITSDNPVFWVASESMAPSPYGFGIAHPNAVIPFPLSPALILRIDHRGSASYVKHALVRQRAKIANRYQARHKDHCLYYRTHHDGLHRLGMKYAEPVQQLKAGIPGPAINVVRSLKR